MTPSPRSTPAALGSALALAFALLPAVARAQVPPVLAPPTAITPEDDSVEALLRRGIALRRDGHDAEALAVFQRAYERAHSATAAAQLGLAEQALGRWLDAERHLREALTATGDAWIVRNHGALEAAFATIGENIGTLDVLGGVRGASVRIDGREVGTLPLREPLRLQAGAVTLEVVASGYYTATRRVGIIGGQPTRETVALRARLPGDTGNGGPRIVYRHENETGWIVAGSVILGVFYLPALVVGVAGFGGCNTSETSCRLTWFALPAAGPLLYALQDSLAPTPAGSAPPTDGLRALEWVGAVLLGAAQFTGIAMLYVGLRGRRVPVVEGPRTARVGAGPGSGWFLTPLAGRDSAGLALSSWF